MANNDPSSAVVLPLSGRVDSNSAQSMETNIRAALGGRKCASLTLDAAGLEYISSAGLRVLLSTQKVMNRQGEMKIRNVSPEIMEIFEVTGFVDILNIES